LIKTHRRAMHEIEFLREVFVADRNNPKNDVQKEVEKILREFVDLPYGLLNECAGRLTELIKKINLRSKKS